MPELKISPLTRRLLNLPPDLELPASANFPKPWQCEFFFSVRANDGLVEYQKMNAIVRDRVAREFVERNHLGHESVMQGAITFEDYLLLQRYLEARDAN